MSDISSEKSEVRREKSIILLASYFLLLTSCFLLLTFTAWAQEGSPDSPDRVVAKVNETAITVQMLDQAVEERIPATGHRTVSEKRLKEIRKEELDKLIIKELLHQEAKRLEIKADSKEIKAELGKIKGRFPSEREFKQALHRQGLTLSDIREGLKRHLMIQKVIEHEIHSKILLTDARLKEYYEGHQEQFRIPEQIRLRLLLVRVDSSGLRTDWEAGRKKAQGLGDQARGGEDFASLAIQFSDDEETREKGGDTGLLHRGRLPYKELETVAFSYNVGEVSDPVETLYGYVVFEVEEKRPSKQLAYGEVNKEFFRREMMETAAKKRSDEWIADLKAKADITIIKSEVESGK